MSLNPKRSHWHDPHYGPLNLDVCGYFSIRMEPLCLYLFISLAPLIDGASVMCYFLATREAGKSGIQSFSFGQWGIPSKQEEASSTGQKKVTNAHYCAVGTCCYMGTSVCRCEFLVGRGRIDLELENYGEIARRNITFRKYSVAATSLFILSTILAFDAVHHRSQTTANYRPQPPLIDSVSMKHWQEVGS